MGRSFVSADNEHGFWMHDTTHELWLFILANRLPTTFDPASKAAAMRTQWIDASKIHAGGIVFDDLSEFASDIEGRSLIREAVQSLRETLTKAPERIDPTALLLFHEEFAFGGPLLRSRLLETADAWLKLLDAQVTTKAKDGWFVPASGSWLS
jgi:hypothetical protein